jgi:hypothetical protein
MEYELMRRWFLGGLESVLTGGAYGSLEGRGERVIIVLRSGTVEGSLAGTGILDYTSGSGTVYTETGGAFGSLFGRGADEATLSRSGGGFAGLVGQGIDVAVYGELGGAFGGLSGQGVDAVIFGELGGVYGSLEGLGGRQVIWTEIGGAQVYLLGSGAYDSGVVVPVPVTTLWIRLAGTTTWTIGAQVPWLAAEPDSRWLAPDPEDAWLVAEPVSVWREVTSAN